MYLKYLPQNLNPGQDSTRRTDDTGGHSTRKSSHAPARLGAALGLSVSQISTQDRTARDEQTTPEDTAHATAHPDPRTTTAKMRKPRDPPTTRRRAQDPGPHMRKTGTRRQTRPPGQKRTAHREVQLRVGRSVFDLSPGMATPLGE